MGTHRNTLQEPSKYAAGTLQTQWRYTPNAVLVVTGSYGSPDLLLSKTRCDTLQTRYGYPPDAAGALETFYQYTQNTLQTPPKHAASNPNAPCGYPKTPCACFGVPQHENKLGSTQTHCGQPQTRTMYQNKGDKLKKTRSNEQNIKIFRSSLEVSAGLIRTCCGNPPLGAGDPRE